MPKIKVKHLGCGSRLRSAWSASFPVDQLDDCSVSQDFVTRPTRRQLRKFGRECRKQYANLIEENKKANAVAALLMEGRADG